MPLRVWWVDKTSHSAPVSSLEPIHKKSKKNVAIYVLVAATPVRIGPELTHTHGHSWAHRRTHTHLSQVPQVHDAGRVARTRERGARVDGDALDLGW